MRKKKDTTTTTTKKETFFLPFHFFHLFFCCWLQHPKRILFESSLGLNWRFPISIILSFVSLFCFLHFFSSFFFSVRLTVFVSIFKYFVSIVLHAGFYGKKKNVKNVLLKTWKNNQLLTNKGPVVKVNLNIFNVSISIHIILLSCGCCCCCYCFLLSSIITKSQDLNERWVVLH